MKQSPRFINVFRTEAKEKIAKNRLQIIKYMLICFAPFCMVLFVAGLFEIH
ncbi:hypothetical protein [Spiroplasma citri]|uniref:Hypothetical transmembrane protein n=1 Tax=Spiroplasma citri TaxID=2133 RepID=Q14QF8_SPICI|nr:hypothetical protein [Spiroplasma citri]APE73944.1 putative ABC transporter [Spiroplasma citri]WFG98413.1 hypothetical protein M1770_00120 [Spiroplasma citri]CAK98271.1 hypothetical transmembrane protein [Spiroplasma citri]